jgi:hypothetical protein
MIKDWPRRHPPYSISLSFNRAWCDFVWRNPEYSRPYQSRDDPSSFVGERLILLRVQGWVCGTLATIKLRRKIPGRNYCFQLFLYLFRLVFNSGVFEFRKCIL